MINLKADDADRILFVEMKGMISEADVDNAIDALQSRYPQVGVHLRGGDRGGFSMLVDWQDLEGREKGAKTLGTIDRQDDRRCSPQNCGHCRCAVCGRALKPRRRRREGGNPVLCAREAR